MGKRAGGVLICGADRPLVAAAARAIAPCGRPLVIQVGVAGARAATRLQATLTRTAVRAEIMVADLGGDAAGRSVVAQAWTQGGRLDAVVVCPLGDVADPAEEPVLVAWEAALGASLRAAFFLVKHAALRLHRGGGGRIIFAAAAPARSRGAIARVQSEGLQCLVDAFARAVPGKVSVAAVVGRSDARGPASRLEIARAVRFLLQSDAPARGAVLHLDATVRRG